MNRILKTFVATVAAVMAATGAADARASTLSAMNGASVGGGASGAGFTLGGEYTLSLSPATEIGGSYDHTFLTYRDGSSGTIRFYGLVARVKVVHGSELFLDTKLGATQRTLAQDVSGLMPGFGLGIGYRIALNDRISLSPRAGVRYFPNSDSVLQKSPLGALADGSVMVSIRF